MARRRDLFLCMVGLLYGSLTFAQGPPVLPPLDLPPVWDLQLGLSFIGTRGNSDTTNLGGDFAFHVRWPEWKLESTATAVSTTDHGLRTAERFLGSVRGDRKLSTSIDFSVGERLERDRLAGMNLRSITDAGFKLGLVRHPNWTLDGLTSLALNHEEPVIGPHANHPVILLQEVNHWIFSKTSDATQRFTFYPDVSDAANYRAEAEFAAQASLMNRLAMKFGYLWRYSNIPTIGFVKQDQTATASLVLRWRSVALVAPPP